MRRAILALRWVVGIVVLLESLHFVLSSAASHHFAKAGLPGWTGPALGGSEAIAAVLFLVPVATVIGGWLLLIVFAIAATLHLLLGELNIGTLLVYGMAVGVCLVDRGKERSKASNER